MGSRDQACFFLEACKEEVERVKLERNDSEEGVTVMKPSEREVLQFFVNLISESIEPSNTDEVERSQNYVALYNHRNNNKSAS